MSNKPQVRFARKGDRYAVSFRYDAKLVALMKTVPLWSRGYDPDTRVWTVDVDYAKGLAADLRAAGAEVLGMSEERRLPPPPPAAPVPIISWADVLLARCPTPEFREKVYKSLARALHTDLGGDGTLMQELNDARNSYGQKNGTTG